MQTIVWVLFVSVHLSNGYDIDVTPIEKHFGAPSFFATLEDCTKFQNEISADLRALRGIYTSRCLPQMLTIRLDNSPIP